MRGGVLHRLLHFEGSEPVLVRIAQLSSDRVLFGARAGSRAAAEWGLERMRFALGVDVDLRPFYQRFKSDPLIGASLRRRPWLRPRGRPEPFEALAWAICEQLIEYERAAAIQRRLVWRFGRHCAASGLRDAPTAAVVADQAPAVLQSLDLSGGRSLALIRVAREVASGRIEISTPDCEPRLRAIPGIGSWTVEMLGLTGQGRLDQVPAGDLAYLKLVGRLRTGNPRGRGTEAEVRELFAPYGEWAGLAGLHALGVTS